MTGQTSERRAWCVWLLLVVVALAVSFAAVSCNGTDTTSSTTGVSAQADVSPATLVAEALGPSVVNIAVADAQGQRLGVGTGVIYNSDGLIITNNHVVTAQGDQPAPSIAVTFATGEELPATLVGRDAISDLAVIRVNRTGLPAAQFLKDLSEVKVGDYAIAIGTPLGLEGTVTLGIVSAVKREVQVTSSSPPADYIQTDAAISPGNSGGALADAQGRVIGINAAGLQPQSGAQNIGFAIPSDVVIFVADQIISQGRVRYSFLGVQTAEITPELKQQFNLGQARGIVILSVEPSSPAGQAGVKPGDIVLGIADQDVTHVADLFSALRKTAPGQQVDLRIIRAGQEQTLKVTLTERPSQ